MVNRASVSEGRNMNKAIALVLGTLALSACDSGEAPSGQVAATVDGTEITVSQINNELRASGVQADQSNAALANQALEAVINRSILAQEARDRGLHQTPAGSLALKRAEEAALVDLLRRDIQAGSPSPSDDEARQFVSSNGAMFSDRFVSVVEQVVVPSLPNGMLKKLEAADTLDEVRTLLNESNVKFQTTMGSVDSLQVAPAVAKQIVDLDVGEVYILPQGDGARINAIVSRQSYPIRGDEALELGRRMVTQQRSSGQVESVFRSILAEKKADVRYSEQYAAPVTQAPASSTDATSSETP